MTAPDAKDKSNHKKKSAKPTPEEIERLRAERAVKKTQEPVKPVTSSQPYIARTLHHFATSSALPRLKVLTWNILAQGLVRRTLFPGSDCLKFKDRNELLFQIHERDADVHCLQEVDRWSGAEEEHKHYFERIAPDTYDHVYAKGYAAKKHGLLLLWKKARFSRLLKVHEVKLDEEKYTDQRTGLSRVTRNIGLCVALKSTSSDKGIIIGTTHMFWHPRQIYERTRQVGLWMRSVQQFRSEQGLHDWPIILAGDYNMQPTELGYLLLQTGGVFDPSDTAQQYMKADWEASRTIHKTVDALKEAQAQEDEEEEEEGGDDPDKVVMSTREPTEEDGLLTFEETLDLFKEVGRARSVYEEKYAGIEGVELFKDRRMEVIKGLEHPTEQLPNIARPGDAEPMYSNFTPLWRCTLDYIFLLPPANASDEIEITALLPFPPGADLEPGLPRKNKSASDHLIAMTELALPL